MILTGTEIEREVSRERISISPFRPEQLNPNSYNYRLARLLRTSSDSRLDARGNQDWKTIEIPLEGLVLHPRRVYLGSTVEAFGSVRYVPTLMGRSSLGRLGMFLQVSADLGNLGTAHCWTLEITVVQKLRIYPEMIVGQVAFWRPMGEMTMYSGRYHDFSGPTPFLTDVARQELIDEVPTNS